MKPFFKKLHISVHKLPIRYDLGMQLITLYIIFIGVVVISTFAFARNTRARLESDIKAADLALARSIAQETDYNLRNAMRAIRELGEFDFVREPDSVVMEELFTTVMSVRPDIESVFRLSGRGLMMYHYPESPTTIVGNDLSFQPFFKNALHTTRPLISNGFISPITAQPVATAAMPIWSERAAFQGLVATNIKLASLSLTIEKIVNEYQPDEEILVAIVDSSGHFIAHPNEEMLLTSVPESQKKIIESVLLGRAGNSIGNNATGDEILYSFVPVSSPGWGVIISHPTDAAFATTRAFYRGVIWILISFVVISILYWFGLYRLAIRPLGDLADYSQEIGDEKPDGQISKTIHTDLAKRSDQVGYLTRSLLGMEKSIEARLNELSTLLQTSAAVLSTLDSQLVLNRILDQLEHLLDVEMSAIVALDQANNLFRVQASHGFSDNYLESLAISPNEPNSITSRAISEKKPLQVADTETDPLYNLPYEQELSRPPNRLGPRERARSAGYRSLLTIPLNTIHTPPSALLIFRAKPHVFSEREITVLSNFANQAAMAIENAALYARSDTRLQEQTRRLEALIQSLNHGLILANLSGTILYANRSICEWANLSVELVVNNSLQHLIKSLGQNMVDPDSGHEAFEKIITTENTQPVEISIIYQHKVKHLRFRSFKVTDDNEIPIGYGHIIQDITADYELDQLKSNLISVVSHELRTPLASIKGYTTTLLADDVKWDVVSQHEFLNVILSETNRLSDLVSSLLDLSRIEAGSLTVSRRECNFIELIQHAAQRAHPVVEERLQIQVAADMEPVWIDQNRIEVVMRNLIENAAKYSTPGTPIKISAACENAVLTVRVEDQGPGIPQDETERVFERFYRLSENSQQMKPGTGLGLAICQGFIEAHGGEIWVEPCQTGACITFAIPGKMPDQANM